MTEFRAAPCPTGHIFNTSPARSPGAVILMWCTPKFKHVAVRRGWLFDVKPELANRILSVPPYSIFGFRWVNRISAFVALVNTCSVGLLAVSAFRWEGSGASTTASTAVVVLQLFSLFGECRGWWTCPVFSSERHLLLCQPQPRRLVINTLSNIAACNTNVTSPKHQQHQETDFFAVL